MALSLRISALVLVLSTLTTVVARVNTSEAEQTLFKEVVELVGSDVGPKDYFGDSVAISGNTIVVGSESGQSGRAYVFAKGGTRWKQVAELKAGMSPLNAAFGTDVAVSGTTIVVGSMGTVFVYGRSENVWHETQLLHGAASERDFGMRVAISGNLLAVGAVSVINVYARQHGAWIWSARLQEPDAEASDGFGYLGPLAISGKIVAVGAPGYNKDRGRGYVFMETNGGWSDAADLTEVSSTPGEFFGNHATVSGQTVVMNNLGGFSGLPRAYVYHYDSGSWQRKTSLLGQAGIGGGLALCGNHLFGGTLGSLAVFVQSAGGLRETTTLKGSDTLEDDDFGASVACSDNLVAVGAPYRRTKSGAVYLFSF